MGFGDKLKASLNNANSRISQSADSASYDSKINDQKRDKEKALQEAGEKMYDVYKSGKKTITDEVVALFDKAKACDAEIEKLQKEDMISKAEKERADRNAEVKKKEEEEKKAREEAKKKEEAEKAKKE